MNKTIDSLPIGKCHVPAPLWCVMAFFSVCLFAFADDVQFEASLVGELTVRPSRDSIAVDAADGVLDETSELYVVWDVTDHGPDINQWPQGNRVRYEGAISAAQATYVVSTPVIPDRSSIRAIATSHVKLIDGYVKLVGYQYVDTGVKCNEAYGIEIRCRPDGTYDGPSSALPQWGSLVGSDPFKFSIGRSAHSNPAISYDQYLLYRGKEVGNPLFMLSTAEGGSAVPHTLKVENQTAYLDGVIVKSGLEAGPLGTDAATIFIGSSNKGDGTSYGRYAPAEWYFARINDASGDALVNLIPARLGSEALFYDTVSGKCFVNSGTSTAPFAVQEGAVATNTLALVCVLASSDAVVGMKGYWTGSAKDGDVCSPVNWACTNSFGEAVADAVPDSSTYVYFPGSLEVRIPYGSSFTCASITFPASVTLTGDSDFSGVPALNADSSTFDLNGHQLIVTSLANVGGIIDSSAEGSGVIAVAVDVAAGQSVTYSDVFDPEKVPDGIDRKIVKTGSGTLAVADGASADFLDAKGGCVAFSCDPYPTLVHRWSFNGNYGDSVGHSDGRAVGDYVAFSGDGKSVVLSSDGSGQSGYVELGTDLIPTDAATLEIWGRVNRTEKWEQIFHYGPDTQNYFLMTWVFNDNAAKDRVEVYANGRSKRTLDGTMAPYTQGTNYHISVTFRTNADGSTIVRWMRRNTVTGALEKSGSAVVVDWTLADVPSALFCLGHSQYPGNHDANAMYDEVRIWHGVRSDEDLSASAMLGPDVLPPDASAGTVYQQQAQYGEEVFARLKANNYLLHRWNFNRNTRDLVGDNDAEFHGGVSYSGNTSVSLTGGTFGTSWIDLGANAIPAEAGDAPFTIEMWTTLHTRTSWGEAFSFGSANSAGTVGETGIIFTYNNSSSLSSFLPCGLNNASYNVANKQIAIGVEYHIAMTVVPDGNGGASVTFYMYDAATGELFGKATQTLANWTTSKIDQKSFWLGHSFWKANKDQNADFNEVRVWNAALSEAQMRINNAYGPDKIPDITAESELSKRDSLRAVDVASGAIVDFGGTALGLDVVSGAGSVTNGQLTVYGRLSPGGDGTVGTLALLADVAVTGAVRLDEGDLIASSAALDLTGAAIEVFDAESLSGGFTFATSSSGGIIGPVGSFDLKGCTVCISPDGRKASIARKGLLLIVR